MKNVKRTAIALALALAVAFALCACGEKPSPEPEPKTYTADENYALFKAGIDHALSYDGAFTGNSVFAYEEDGEKQKTEKVFSRDGNKRVSVDKYYRQNGNGEFELDGEQKCVFKPVMQDGHERILYYSYSSDSEDGEDESLAYIRADYVDSVDPNDRETPDVIIERAGCEGADFAAYTAAVKKSYTDDEDYEGLTEDKISVTIARTADNEVTVTITITDYVTEYTYNDFNDGKEYKTTITENTVFEVSVSDGKVTKVRTSAKADYLYGKDGSTDTLSSQFETSLSYAFGNELLNSITFDEADAVNREGVMIYFVLGGYKYRITCTDFNAYEPITVADVKTSFSGNTGSEQLILGGTADEIAAAYELYLDEDLTQPLTDGYVATGDMNLYVKLLPVSGNGGRSFVYTVVEKNGTALGYRVFIINFAADKDTKEGYPVQAWGECGAGGVTINGEPVTDFTESGKYVFYYTLRSGNIYTVVRKA